MSKEMKGAVSRSDNSAPYDYANGEHGEGFVDIEKRTFVILWTMESIAGVYCKTEDVMKAALRRFSSNVADHI